MPISDKHKAIFIHIPKTAGVSISNLLKLDMSKDCLISVKSPIYQHFTPTRLKNEGLIKEDKWKSYFKFTIIRNPFERCISDYIWLKNKVCPIHGHKIEWYGGDFKGHLLLRKRIIESKNYDEFHYYDHFIPLIEYFENIEYDLVIRFENIEKEIEILKEKLNINEDLHRLNSNDCKKDYKNFYNEETIKLVEEIYEEDLNRFEYSFEMLK